MNYHAFSSKSIFVTGAAGFIGSEFVRQIQSLNYFDRIFLLDSFTYAADINRISSVTNTPRFELIRGSINDTSAYNKALLECSVAVHFAAESHVDKSISNGYPFVETNVLGSYIFLENCRANRNLLTLFVSTDEVYGSVLNGFSEENDKLDPSSVYSASKAASDLLALANSRTHSQKLILTRCCNNYGKFQHSEKFIPTIINNLLENKKVPVYGDGLNSREWIHVSDHVNALFQILLSGVPGEIYNIGTGDVKSNLEIVDMILKLMNKDSSSISFVEDRKGHDYRYALNSNKIRDKILWEKKVNLEGGLSSTIEWYRNWKLQNSRVYS